MRKQEIIQILSKKIKLVRTEANYSQDLMSDILGISKKTLVQIEKGRVQASWTVIVALCSLFSESIIIQDTLGSDPLDILQVVAHQRYSTPMEQTLKFKDCWTEEDHQGPFKIQKNLVSGHYRIIDNEKRKWYCSFDKEEVKAKLLELSELV